VIADITHNKPCKLVIQCAREPRGLWILQESLGGWPQCLYLPSEKKLGHLLMLGHETIITFIFKGYRRKDTICATHVVMIANIAMIEPITLSCKSVMVAIPTPTSSVTSESWILWLQQDSFIKHCTAWTYTEQSVDQWGSYQLFELVLLLTILQRAWAMWQTSLNTSLTIVLKTSNLNESFISWLLSTSTFHNINSKVQLWSLLTHWKK
jgi:hypothetical protein